MAQPSSVPILDIAIAKRPTILIDRKPFEMRTSNEFTWIVYTEFQRKFQRLGQLLTKRKKTAAEWKEQARLQDDFVRAILIAPDPVHARLGDMDRLEIIKAFFTQVRTKTSAPLRPPMSPRAAPTRNGTT